MKTATPLLIALYIVAASQAAASEACTPLPSSTEARARSSFTKESATVEDVLSTVQDGYRSRAYIVTWHGTRVLVSDPLAQSNAGVGDSIDFVADRVASMTGDRVLLFTMTDRSHRTADVSGSSSFSASSTNETGVVQEALSAQDDGFRFAAYIVTSQGQRIAVSDPLALSHHAIGEQIDFVAGQSASPGGQLLYFDVQLSAAEEAAIARQPLCGMQRSLEMGVVDQVLSAQADGYQYRAYIIDWRGTQVLIEDPTAVTTYQAGENVNFWVNRFQLPLPGGHRTQNLTFERPPQTTVVNQTSNFAMSISMESAPVQTVLAPELDGYRSVAYLVSWHNTSIAVVDPFATTPLAPGDLVSFSVARSTGPNGKGLRFMLRPTPRRCMKPPASSDNSTSAATTKTPASACHH